MDRQEALDWLNYRLKLEEEMKRHNHFTMTDLEFFMTFIKERSGKNVHINDLINSIRYHSESCINWVERLINYLIYTHKIETVTEIKSGMTKIRNMSLGIPEDSLKIIKYK